MGTGRNLLKIVFLLCYMILFLSCSSGAFKIGERKEGFEKGILRVYVREDLPETDSFQGINIDKLWNELSAKNRDRAIHLLLSWIRSHISDPSKFSKYDDSILNCVDKGSIIYKEYNDDYCEMFIDYPVTSLMDEIKLKIN